MQGKRKQNQCQIFSAKNGMCTSEYKAALMANFQHHKALWQGSVNTIWRLATG